MEGTDNAPEVAAVVDTVNVDMTAAPLGVTWVGFKLQVGASDGDGETEQVRLIGLLKLPCGVMVTVAVVFPPADSVGESRAPLGGRLNVAFTTWFKAADGELAAKKRFKFSL